jgi:hypothetical protein
MGNVIRARVVIIRTRIVRTIVIFRVWNRNVLGVIGSVVWRSVITRSIIIRMVRRTVFVAPKG